MSRLVLASASPIRSRLLEAAGLHFTVHPVHVDEAAIRDSLLAEGARPRDIADTIAEYKARRAAERLGSAMVLGSDQILSLDAEILSKPVDRQDAADHLARLSGRTHQLHSAAVIYENGASVWRHVGSVRMVMHALTTRQIEAYLDRAWPDVSGCLGAYQAEALGACLFSRMDGDWFSVLGLPLLEVLSFLRQRQMLETS